MKNTWLLCAEIFFWSVLVIFCGAYQLWGCPASLKGCYDDAETAVYLHYLLPSYQHTGLAGFSFISVTTGLNLALVKFEVFVKSLEDIQKQWQAEIDQQLLQLPETKVDDTYTPEIDKFIKNAIMTETKTAYEEHRSIGMFWRWWAIRFNIMGLALLFFQCSAGVLGLIFVLPVLGSVRAKNKCKTKLNDEINSLKKLARSISDAQADRKSDVDKAIQSA